MVGLAEVGAAVGGLKTAYDMAKGLADLSQDAKTKLATIDLMQAILAAQQHAVGAQQAQMELLKAVADLEAKLAAVDDWKAIKARYILHQFPAGAQAYVLRDEHKDEPYHRLCANCFEKGEKSILQTVNKHSGGEQVKCQRCSMQLTLSDFNVGRVTVDRGSDYF